MAEPKDQPETPETSNAPQPGDTIVPAGAPRPAAQRVSVLDTPPAPSPPVPVPPKPVIIPEPQPEPTPIPLPVPPVQIPQTPPPEVVLPPKLEPQPEPIQVSTLAQSDPNTITWTALEFVAHEKSASWYAYLAAATVIISGLIFLATGDPISTGIVVFCAVLFGIIASRKPRQVQYRISRQGVGVGNKYHSYDEFRSFSIAPDGAFSSIIFQPLKRFAVLTTIYYAPEDEEKILNTLNDRLPFAEHTMDPIDWLMSRIRF